MKKNNMVIYISVFLLVIALMGSIFWEDVSSKVTEAITIGTAILGALALFIQFKKDKEVNQAEFMNQLSYQFYDQDGLVGLLSKLEKYRKGNKKALVESDYDDIVNYLQWCEGIASLVNKKILDLAAIDDLFFYRFFVATNNEYVQKVELFPEKHFYPGIYKVYTRWIQYKKKNNLYVMMPDTQLIPDEITKKNP